MIEKVIENWLDNSSERSFQVPYCFLLAQKGHTVIHLTRHCSLEFGKDIITIDPNGVPCAFQLKAGNITLKQWQTEILPQANQLIYQKLSHPSLTSNLQHKCFLVTNGYINEEVSVAIEQFNETSKARNLPVLNTIVRGELLSDALKLKEEFWPTELSDTKILLELLLYNGKEILPKHLFASLFESLIPFKKNNLAQSALKRIATACSLINAIALSNFIKEDNYFAIIEAWTILCAYIFGMIEKWGLTDNTFKNEISICFKAIRNSMKNIILELSNREHLCEGNIVVDGPFFRIRYNIILSIISVYCLWEKLDKNNHFEFEDFCREFLNKNLNKMLLWGENSIPKFLSVYWYFRKIDATRRPDALLTMLIEDICKTKNSDTPYILPSPYVEAKDFLPYMIDNEISSFLPNAKKLAKEPLKETYKTDSHFLEGLVNLIVRRNWKQTVRFLWYKVTFISFLSLRYAEPYHFLKWRNDRSGTLVVKQPIHRKNWDLLKVESMESEGSILPNELQKYPVFVLLYCVVNPPRMDSSIIRWMDSKFKYL